MLQARLRFLEHAYESLSFGAGLPRPHASRARPLLWISDQGELRVEVELLKDRGFDQGRAQCTGGSTSSESALSCITQASLMSLAPSTARHLSSGLGASMALGLLEGPEAEAAAQSSFSAPHVGVLTSTAQSRSWRGGAVKRVDRRRSLRFLDYLERRSPSGLGEASFLALALGSTKTSAGALRFEGEPDLIEVLSATFLGDRNDVARTIDDFAQDSFHAAQLYGGKMELAWKIDGASLPRSLTLKDPLEPTGSAYLLLTLTEEQKSKKLAFRMWCEAPVSYVWSVARLDESGQELSLVPVAYRQRGGDAATTVEPMAGTHQLLLVGTNLGGVDPGSPLRP